MKKASFNIVTRTNFDSDDYVVIKIDGYVTDDGFGIDKRDAGWTITDLYSGMSITTLKRKCDCAMYLVDAKIPFEKIKKAREFGHEILKKYSKEN